MKTIQIKVLLIPILVILLNFKDSFSQSNDIRVLDIEYINQVHGCCWCWAACITSIANYYGNDNIQLYGYDDDGEMIHYIDPGSGYWEESYYNMTNTYCIGTWDRMYGYGASCSYRISSDPCPTNLNLTVNIGSDAVITASNSIQCSSTINNNAEVEFISGNILLNNGFAVEIGASLAIEISSNPCQ